MEQHPEAHVEAGKLNEAVATNRANAADDSAVPNTADAQATSAASETPNTSDTQDASAVSETSNVAPFDLILASKSPRRRQLLTQAGVAFRLVTPLEPVNETLEEEEYADPVAACKKLAERKAGAVVQEFLAADPAKPTIVLGADTMVVKGSEIFGKPRSLSDAKHMLRTLADDTHEVVTAVSLWMIAPADDGKVSVGFRTFADVSYVTFKPLTDEEIADYLRKGESFDKAGAYAAQGEGAKLIEKIEGSLDTVIGLPVERLLREFPDLALSKQS